MRNRILERLENKKKEKNKSIMFLDKNQDQGSNVNLNLKNWRDVNNPDLMNALTLGGATFLGSSGIRNLSTTVKQNKAWQGAYNEYINWAGGDQYIEL